MQRHIQRPYWYLPFIVVILASLACGSFQVGMVTPTPDNDSTNVVDTQEPTAEVGLPTEEIPSPTEEPGEDFSHLWIEYWDPKYGYGLALPAHWIVSPTPLEGDGGVMVSRSYDEEFFMANSVKGNWTGGQAPLGAVKVDFVGFEGVLPEQSVEIAINQFLSQEQSITLSIEEVTIGNHTAYIINQANRYDPNETWYTVAFRIQPEVILLVAAYPLGAIESQDVQGILESISFSKSKPIVKPTFAPHPPLTVSSEVSGLPTASAAIAWYGHIASLPEGSSYDDKVILSPAGTGEFGIQGYTPALEAEIDALRDTSGPNEYIHLWGVLYCNVDDYNTCQLNVERIEYGDQYTDGYGGVDNWVGTIKTTTFNGALSYVLEMAEGVPVWYGIAANEDDIIQSQIESLSDSETIVSVWGDLLVGVPDVNGTRIEVSRLDPPAPGALPSSSTCESGYMSTADEALEVLQYSLEIGNFYPFTYLMGNPFVIGYWRSEGVSLPRQEAFTQLETNYLPSPEQVVIISDPALFPSLDGTPLSTMWGPDVDVAANLYSTGWGPDGQGEAILVISRCQQDTYDAYYWYGMLYAMDGFE
jgi:hypothetical protein